MVLDGLTLMAAGSFVTAVSAILLLGAWTQIRNPALLWWTVSAATNSAAIAVLATGIPTGNVAAIAAGFGIGTLGPILLWCGFRSFNHLRQFLPGMVAGPLAVVAAGILPLPGGPALAGQAVGFLIWVAYLVSAAIEAWRGRSEPLGALWPVVGFILLHAAVFVGGVFDLFTGQMPAGVVAPLSSWFSMIQLETLIYAIGTSVFLVLMCKERSERRYIHAARNDSLTGIANRGALVESAQRALRRCQSEGISFSLILFDLDRFKHVNDTFGHDVGDDLLRRFADITRNVLRPNDIFGRYGGEEFIVVLPSATIEAAYVIAERIRHKFAEVGTLLGARRLDATVSGGVASATSTTTLETIIRDADLSMYEAKRLGRNRIERTPRDPEAELEAVVRIA
jgi:diguanylate cyclase (GGDEF)-like protein